MNGTSRGEWVGQKTKVEVAGTAKITPSANPIRVPSNEIATVCTRAIPKLLTNVQLMSGGSMWQTKRTRRVAIPAGPSDSRVKPASGKLATSRGKTNIETTKLLELLGKGVKSAAFPGVSIFPPRPRPFTRSARTYRLPPSITPNKPINPQTTG